MKSRNFAKKNFFFMYIKQIENNTRNTIQFFLNLKKA